MTSTAAQRSLGVALAAMVLAGGYAAWLRFAPSTEAEVVYPHSRLVRYGFTLRNTSGELLRGTEFRVFAPVRETATQRSVSIDASHPFELSEDELGNQILVFRFTIPPYGAKVVRVSAQLELADAPNPRPAPRDGRFLGEERYVEVEDPRIQGAARELPGEGGTEVAQAAYEWVVARLRDPGYVREDRGALYALEQRQGDCTEHMYLFTALARARGIPARGVGGFVLAESGVLRSGDYHNWAEFHAGDTWRIADPQRRVFDAEPGRYVAMRIIGRGEASPMGNSHRFVAFHDAVEVRMN